MVVKSYSYAGHENLILLSWQSMFQYCNDEFTIIYVDWNWMNLRNCSQIFMCFVLRDILELQKWKKIEFPFWLWIVVLNWNDQTGNRLYINFFAGTILSLIFNYNLHITKFLQFSFKSLFPARVVYNCIMIYVAWKRNESNCLDINKKRILLCSLNRFCILWSDEI